MKLPGRVKKRLLAAYGCLALLAFANAPAGLAQEPYPEVDSVEAQYSNPYLRGTKEEEAALRTLESYMLVKLREDARAVLKSNPDSYAGHYLLGFSLHNSEGDLPRAKFHLNRAKSLFIARHTATPKMDDPWGWYERILLELIQVNAEMDAYEEQVATIDEYMSLGKVLSGQEPPNMLAAYAWPLMKLEREAEARAKLAKVADHQDEMTRSTYLNTLGALEMEFGHPKASYQAFKQLVDDVRSNGWSQSCTYLRNLGEAAAGIGQFDEAERLYSEATRYFDSFTYSNPWFDLTFMYLSQARFPEAVDALKRTHEWRFAVQPFLAQQTWAQDQHATAELLLQLGETQKGLEIAENIVRRPDRQGGDSIQLDQKAAGTLLLYHSLLVAEASRLKESQTWTGGWDWWQAMFKRRELLAKARLAEVQIQALVTKNNRVSASFRPYYAPRTIIVGDWHRPDLVAIYGAGVAKEALDAIYETPPESFAWEKPVLDVMQAEVAYERGDNDEAIEILKAGIPELTEARAVLRARAEARLAGLLFDEGRFEEAMEVGTRVFDTAPAMFRHLDISVPITITADADPQAQEVASALGKSPRFHADSRGYPVKIVTSGSNLIASISTPQGSLLAEASAPLQDKEREPMTAAEDLTARFHQKAFAPRIDLSQKDINSLDGSTLTESRRSDRAKEAIGRPTNPPAHP
jgi:tetratricopeptide (TPR) repeat protein